jgi:hypothetical protein
MHANHYSQTARGMYAKHYSHVRHHTTSWPPPTPDPLHSDTCVICSYRQRDACPHANKVTVGCCRRDPHVQYTGAPALHPPPLHLAWQPRATRGHQLPYRFDPCSSRLPPATHQSAYAPPAYRTNQSAPPALHSCHHQRGAQPPSSAQAPAWRLKPVLGNYRQVDRLGHTAS